MNDLEIALLVSAFGILSLLFFSISRICNKNLVEKKRVCTEETTATVINVRTKRILSSDVNSNTYYFTYRYVVDGEIVEQESGTGSSVRCFENGDKVKLYYNPKQIRQIYIPADKTSSVGSIFKFMGIMFACVCVLGIVLFVLVFNKVI